ncbi:MAG: signal peptidase II [Actinomycetota bacterium]
MQATRRTGSLIPLRLLGTAAAVVALDQLTKSAAVAALADGPIEVIPGVLTLRLHSNTGGAFGILQGYPGFFLVATAVVMITILLWARRVDDRRLLIPLGLVLGGGGGNLADRLFRGDHRSVVDFVDLHVWPLFNVADAAIVAGVALIFLLSVRPPRAGTPHRADDPPEPSSNGP